MAHISFSFSILDISPIASAPPEGDQIEGGDTQAAVNGGEPTPISLRHVSIEARKVLRDLQLPAKFDGTGKKEGERVLTRLFSCLTVNW